MPKRPYNLTGQSSSPDHSPGDYGFRIGPYGGDQWGQRPPNPNRRWDQDYGREEWLRQRETRDGDSPGSVERFFEALGDRIEHFIGRGPKSYRRSDQRIEEHVNELLTDHPDIDASEIVVTVKDGEVTLAGRVPERHMKRLAEDAVDRIWGVTEVYNQLRTGATPDSQPRS